MNKKLWLFVLAIFGFGVIVGYCIHGWILGEPDPILQGILGIGASFGLSFGVVLKAIDIFRDYRARKNETRAKNNEFIVEDIKNWVKRSSSLMAYLEYRAGHIKHNESKDPEDLPYYEETKVHLKAYNCLSLWEQAKTYSQKLKDKGKNALEKFDKKVAEIIRDLQLARSDLPGWEGRIPYCNLTRIRDAIFVEVNHRMKGNPYYDKFSKGTDGKYYSLLWGGTRLARVNRHNEEILDCLKDRIEGLIDDNELRRKITVYEDVKSKMEGNNFLEQFNEKVKDEIINPFKMGMLLKGKCRFC